MTWARAITLLILTGLAGCGSGDPNDSAPLVPVTGTITRNGKPMADARVTFLPDKGNKYNTPGVDTTGPEGNYKLKFNSGSGVSVGKYKVSVEPSLAPPGADKMPDAFKNDPLMWQMAHEAKNPGKKARGGTSEAGSKSEFEADVSDKGGVFDFEVNASSTRSK